MVLICSLTLVISQPKSSDKLEKQIVLNTSREQVHIFRDYDCCRVISQKVHKIPMSEICTTSKYSRELFHGLTTSCLYSRLAKRDSKTSLQRTPLQE